VESSYGNCTPHAQPVLIVGVERRQVEDHVVSCRLVRPNFLFPKITTSSGTIPNRMAPVRTLTYICAFLEEG